MITDLIAADYLVRRDFMGRTGNLWAEGILWAKPRRGALPLNARMAGNFEAESGIKRHAKGRESAGISEVKVPGMVSAYVTQVTNSLEPENAPLSN